MRERWRLGPAWVAIAVGIGGVLGGAACQRTNPAYRGATGAAGSLSGAAGTGAGGDVGAAGSAGSGGTTGVAGTVGNAGSGGTTGVAGTVGNAGSGGAAGIGGRGGGTCTDRDGDGYGSGGACLGLDCDDSDATVTLTAERGCYTGTSVTRKVGVCRDGIQRCVNGSWLDACNGEVLPSGEACNGEDDDCDGTPDDGFPTISCGIGACAAQVPSCAGGKLGVCLPGVATAVTDGCDGVDNDCDGLVDEDCASLACVRVSTSGDDNGANGTDKPFRNIQAAITWAAGASDRPKRVCVAGGPTCQDRATFQSPDSMAGIVMANGVSVYGNYESTTWTRCALSPAQLVSPGPSVTIQTQTATGVQFGAAITQPTTLDGFAFVRQRGDSLASTSAVTVDGAKQVTLSNLAITDAPVATASWGINLINGAQALITRSIVAAGGGTTDAVAIRSVGATPIVRENCSAIDTVTGRCSTTSCSGLGLRGRGANTSGGSSGTGPSNVVMLKDSPGAIVERNVICGGPAGDLAGVRIGGVATGTVVRGNSILVTGGTGESDGVWLDPCGDATPWIVDNDTILGDGSAGASVAAVRAIGACHPVIDGNAALLAGGSAATNRVAAVLCGAAGGVASRCAIVGNKLVQGATSNHPALSIGVSCEAGGCARIAGNTITGNVGTDAVGVAIAAGGPFVERNTITGGCGTRSTAGILADDASARIENNVVRGAVCGSNLATPLSLGLHIHVTLSGNEVGVHSNTVDAGGAGNCSGAAVSFGAGTATSVSSALRVGIFRNDILRAGACATARYDFWEDTPPAGPRILQNDDFDPTGSPTALYFQANATSLTTAAAINAITGTTAGANISVDPMFVAAPADLHLGAGSTCANAGTSVGAPTRDFDGKARDAKPDIGAFEQ